MTAVPPSTAGASAAKAPPRLPVAGGEPALQTQTAEGGFASLLRQAGTARAEAQAQDESGEEGDAGARTESAKRSSEGPHREAASTAEVDAPMAGPAEEPDAAADMRPHDRDATEPMLDDRPASATAQDMALMFAQLQQKPDAAAAGATASAVAQPGVEAVGDVRTARLAGHAAGMPVPGDMTSTAASSGIVPDRAGTALESPTAAHGERSAATPVDQTPAEAAAAAGSARWQTRMLGQTLADRPPVTEAGASVHPAAASAQGPAGSAVATVPQPPSDAVLAAQHGASTPPRTAPEAAVQPQPTVVSAEAALAGGWKRVDVRDAEAPQTASATVALHGWSGGGVADLGGTLPITAPSAAAHAGTTLGDASDALLDPISWWAAQQVQGAQLTVAGPGDAPVSVQLRLQGQEAQVLFQSDDRQARQLIHQSLPQLEQMLAGQGLSLGSASVGTAPGQGQGAGAQAQGGGSPPAESGAGRSSADPVDLPPAAASAGTRRPGQGALDLFV